MVSAVIWTPSFCSWSRKDCPAWAGWLSCSRCRSPSVPVALPLVVDGDRLHLVRRDVAQELRVVERDLLCALGDRAGGRTAAPRSRTQVATAGAATPGEAEARPAPALWRSCRRRESQIEPACSGRRPQETRSTSTSIRRLLFHYGLPCEAFSIESMHCQVETEPTLASLYGPPTPYGMPDCLYRQSHCSCHLSPVRG